MLKFAYTILEIPVVYDVVQNVLGAKRFFAKTKQLTQKRLANFVYQNVLDIGCGTGIAAGWFIGDYYGIDINPRYIRKNRKDKRNSFFQIGDATALPFKDETFELVFTLGVLHHLDDKGCQNMLSEMMRVCKQGGRIVIVDGLVPSNKFNIIGHILARLDRGRYKIRIEKFQAMLSTILPPNALVSYKAYNVFPSEYVLSIINK